MNESETRYGMHFLHRIDGGVVVRMQKWENKVTAVKVARNCRHAAAEKKFYVVFDVFMLCVWEHFVFDSLLEILNFSCTFSNHCLHFIENDVSLSITTPFSPFVSVEKAKFFRVLLNKHETSLKFHDAVVT